MGHKKIFLLFIIFALIPVSFTSCSKKVRMPNILLVTIDTLRRDHLGTYGYPRQTSPFIDSLSENGLMFKNVITPIPITAGSHATILTSLHPLTHGLLINGQSIRKKVQTLAEVLKKSGYYTIGTTSVYLLRKGNGFNQGFDSYITCSPPQKKKKSDPRQTVPAPAVNKKLFKQIEKYLSNHKEKPVFIWAHYFDPHAPYQDRGFKFKEDIPGEIREKSRDNLDAIDRYDTEIRFVDETLRVLYYYLKEKDIAGNMVTCITSDHGEQHGEHGHRNTHYDFYSETTFVPLIFHGYKIPRGKVSDDYVSTMDIAETLVRAAGSKFKNKTNGVDLLAFARKWQADKRLNSNREFLIVGHPTYTKSLQLIKFPFSYILNFDRYYKYWYYSKNSDLVPEHKFKPVKKEHIVNVKRESQRLTVRLPDEFEKGLKYAAVRFKLDESVYKKKVNVLYNYRLFTQMTINLKTENLCVFHPVTTLDRSTFTLNLRVPLGTRSREINYTILSEKEFLDYSRLLEKKENMIFDKLLSLRKHLDLDEWYNLEKDLEMDKNLLALKSTGTYTMNVDEYKELLYKWFEYYYKKGKKLFGQSKQLHVLSKKERNILKSLGYL